MNLRASFSILAMVVAANAPTLSMAYTFDSDVPAAIKTQITTDMEFMAALAGSQGSALHKEIFESDIIDGAKFKAFFESRVTAVGMNSCGSANAVACVIPWRNSSKIWLTQNYVRFSHPQIAKMMIVFHEARHTETAHGNFMHATCPSPFVDDQGQEIRSIWTGAVLAGEPACDDNAYGSYASSMIMLKNVAKFCTNCTEKVLQDAGMYADDQFKRVTDDQARAQIMADLYQADSDAPVVDPGQPEPPVPNEPGFGTPWWPLKNKLTQN